MKKRKGFIYFSFILSLFFIISGIILVVCSFKSEILDEKYIIDRATNYTSTNKDLKTGEFSVTKDVIYVSKGTYKITYKINYNQEDQKILFASKSKVSITDIISDSYKLDTDRILINKSPMKLYSSNTITSDYEIHYDNNTFEISFPKDKLFKHHTITYYLTLIDRNINTEYVTSKESYYSFTPSKKNDYYQKKASQSYVIEGNGIIILKDKKSK